MHRIPAPFRVYVGLVPTGYLAPEAIDRVVRAGLAFVGAATKLEKLRPGNRLLVIPDIAMAEPKIARHAHTHPEVLRAVLSETLALDRGGYVTVLGRTLGGFTPSRVLKRAGYYELENRFPGRAEVICEDQSEVYRYQLSKGGVLSGQDKRGLLGAGILNAPRELLRSRFSNELLAPADFYKANVVIYCPKLKSSVTSQGFSGAVRLGPGPARGTFNDVTAADMLEVCNPQIIASDGIIAAVGGNQFTERGHELGVVLVANNAVAHDLIAAQIFNLEPEKINHLRIAIERGWGPSSLGQIELGGEGIEAVRQLKQKTQYWDLGSLDVEDFGAKFERENPGLVFPLEVISGHPYETAGSHGALLEWLYLSYDTPARRAAMARWPRASLCVGKVEKYPAHALVFAVGNRACETIVALTSSSRRLLSVGRSITIERAQFKNGRRHFVVKVRGAPPSLRRLFVAFAVGSLGAMVPRVLTPALLADRLLYRLRRLIHSTSPIAKTRLVIASRMRHNDWWALKPVRLALTQRAGDAR